MSEDDENNVLTAYTSYIDDVNQLRATQAVRDATQVTILTIFLGAQAYVASLFLTGDGLKQLPELSLVSLIPVAAVVGIGYVGRRFCKIWQELVRDYKSSANTKFKNLEIMERNFPENLKQAGIQLFLEESYIRHPERRPNQIKAANSGTALPEATEKVQEALVEVSKAKERSQGAAKRAEEVQVLFEKVLIYVSVTAIVIKALGVGLPHLIPWLLQIHLP